MGDMTVQNGKLGVTIWASKTNQSGKGRSMVLATCADWELCPVIAVTEFLTLQGMGDSPLLYHCDGNPPPPRNKYQFGAVTAKVLEVLR